MERLAKQLNAGKLTLVSAARANAAVAAAAPAAAPASPAAAPAADVRLACIEIGAFGLADGRRFEALLAPLALGDRQSRRNVAGQEISSYIVYIPQTTKEGAERKVGELKQLGVANYFIMSDNPVMRWGISLGVFKSEAGAQTLLAALNKQGVHSARVAPRMSASRQLAFQFRDIDAAAKARLDRIAAGFPEQDSKTCK